MGCQSSYEKYNQKLFELSKLPSEQTNSIIEQIKKLTDFKEKEIYYLMKQFYSLDPNEEGLISNSQLLEFPQFKYSPFKKHLIRVFKLDTTMDRDVLPYLNENNEDYIDFNTEKEKLNNKLINSENDVKNQQNSDSSKNQDEMLIDFGNPEILEIKRENKKNVKFENQNNFIASIDNSNKKSSYLNIPDLISNKYITLLKFCEIMNVFYNDSDVELKIRFYFDLFDEDSDGRLNRNDLKYFFESLIETDEDNVIANEENYEINLNSFKEHMNKMVERIMKEVLINSRRKYIVYRDFKDLMYDSNIDRTCVIDFEEEY